MRKEWLCLVLMFSIVLSPGCRERSSSESASDVKFNLRENPNFLALPKASQEKYLALSARFKEHFKSNGFHVYEVKGGEKTRINIDAYYDADLTQVEGGTQYYIVTTKEADRPELAFAHKSVIGEAGVTIHLSGFAWNDGKPKVLARDTLRFGLDDTDYVQQRVILEEKIKAFAGQIAKAIHAHNKELDHVLLITGSLVFSSILVLGYLGSINPTARWGIVAMAALEAVAFIAFAATLGAAEKIK